MTDERTRDEMNQASRAGKNLYETAMLKRMRLLAVVFGIIGALMLATKSDPYAGWQCFLLSSVLLTAWAFCCRYVDLAIMQVLFCVIDIIGIIKWKP